MKLATPDSVQWSSVNLASASRSHLATPAPLVTPSTRSTASKMQCYICVTYMIILCGAGPAKNREIATTHEKRSLFRDVIESLRIHSQLPEDINQNDENNLSQNYVRYGYENEPSLPSDADYIPRRNDRIEMPSMKYRFPKSLNINSSDEIIRSREEVVVFIDTNKHKTTTKPKKGKRTRPPYIKNKLPNTNKENEDAEITESESEDANESDDLPFTNTMAGQSQIGNRESQTVMKPTVIVNIRGTVSNRDSDIRLEGREEELTNRTEPYQNIFNINQEIKIEKEGPKKKPSNVKQEIKMVASNENTKIEEDMMMCETATWKPDKSQESRKLDNVLHILFSI